MGRAAALRILVVDDAATVRRYHRMVLEGDGFAVKEAFNGIDALEQVLSEPFDLVLVDVNMPKLDGFGFLRDLRARDCRQVPAIVISNEADETDRQQAWEAGANYYLVKPIRPERLVPVCRTLLGLPGEPA